MQIVTIVIILNRLILKLINEFKINKLTAKIFLGKNMKIQNRDPRLETSGKIIGFYKREFFVL